MAQLVVRNLPDEVKDRLKRRARAHGRSLEAEVREILQQVPEAVAPATPTGEKVVAELLAKLDALGIGKKDTDALEANIAELRRDWHAREFDSGQ